MSNVAVFKKIVSASSIISSRAMLVKIGLIYKLLMKLPESSSTISVAKLRQSLIVCLLLVNGSKMGTKYIASLHAGVCKADKFGLEGRQPLKHFACTLQKPYNIPDLVPPGFRCFRASSDMLLESRSFL